MRVLCHEMPAQKQGAQKQGAQTQGPQKQGAQTQGVKLTVMMTMTMVLPLAKQYHSQMSKAYSRQAASPVGTYSGILCRIERVLASP